MTDIEKADIARLRAQGASYGTIAARLGLPENTVKSFCRRNNLQSNNGQQTQGEICLYCGKDIEQKVKRADRKFCSEPCRRAWWRANDTLINRRAYYSMTCAHCGEQFESYGNKSRKYCGHSCYIKARFQGGINNDAGTI